MDGGFAFRRPQTSGNAELSEVCWEVATDKTELTGGRAEPVRPAHGPLTLDAHSPPGPAAVRHL